jgi:hypothetical protein
MNGTNGEICQTCDEVITNDLCGCCGNCEHIRGGDDENCSCDRHPNEGWKDDDGNIVHARCGCECHYYYPRDKDGAIEVKSK